MSRYKTRVTLLDHIEYVTSTLYKYTYALRAAGHDPKALETVVQDIEDLAGVVVDLGLEYEVELDAVEGLRHLGL